MENSDIQKFWAWFGFRSEELSRSEEGDSVRGELAQNLTILTRGLYYELSSYDKTSDSEFIITAHGKKSLFPAAARIAAEAPPIAGWRIYALKPATGFNFKTEYEGHSYVAEDLKFLPMERKTDPRYFGLRVAVPELPDDEGSRKAARTAILLMLETGLGERQCVEEIHGVELVQASKETDDFLRLKELPRFLSWRRSHQKTVKARKEGR